MKSRTLYLLIGVLRIIVITPHGSVRGIGLDVYVVVTNHVPLKKVNIWKTEDHNRFTYFLQSPLRWIKLQRV